jgi:hypothetical protein
MTTNPFVATAVNLMREGMTDQDPKDQDLADAMAQREPRLSALNIGCAIREAARLLLEDPST